MSLTLKDAESLYEMTFNLISEMKPYNCMEDKRRILQGHLTKLRGIVYAKRDCAEREAKVAKFEKWETQRQSRRANLEKLAALRPVLTREEIKDRNLNIFVERQSGETLSSIGKKHGISPTRVKSICNKIQRASLSPPRMQSSHSARTP